MYDVILIDLKSSKRYIILNFIVYILIKLTKIVIYVIIKQTLFDVNCLKDQKQSALATNNLIMPIDNLL